MRDPNNMIYEINEGPDVLKLDDYETFEIEEFDVFDPKEFTKYIRTIKSSIRTSFEYRSLIAYLKNTIDMNSCAIYENVNTLEAYGVKIEIHHHPFTLEDIIQTVFNKRTALTESIDVEDISKEVMKLHYQMSVGLIPLSTTIHELVHGNFLFIPMDKVFGDVDEFIDEYKQYMSPELIEKLDANIEATKLYKGPEYNKLLEVKHMNIEVKASPLPKFDDIKELLVKAKKENS